MRPSLRKKVPKGSDPNGTLFKKRYHWGLTPLVSFCVLDFQKVAGEHAAVFTAQMHCATLAVSPRLTFAALIGLHPFAVAIRFETVLPDFPKIILMYVALMIVTAYAQTTRYGTVIKY